MWNLPNGRVGAKERIKMVSENKKDNQEYSWYVVTRISKIRAKSQDDALDKARNGRYWHGEDEWMIIEAPVLAEAT